MKKFILSTLVVLTIIGIGLGFLFKGRIDRIRMAASLFSGAEQYQNFGRIPEMFPHATMPPADDSMQFGEAQKIELPNAFTYNSKPVGTETFLRDTDTVGLLVIKDGDVRLERYMLTGGRKIRWLSMSVAKSFVSALVGIAVDEGHIASIEDPITKYVPKLAGSAYDEVRIKDILQMSSGARWNEDYSDSQSDINRFSKIFAIGGSMNDFAATLERENEPGTVNHYNSIDTQVLGMLLVNATGKSITEYMTEKLWHPMGAESPGHWLIDNEGMEMAFGGLNATARDYAKIGELYRQGGKLNDQQIVPAQWVKASVTPDAPHLQPGSGPDPEFTFGYGYQWWIPKGDEGEFVAIGVYNQFIYVNPAHDVVIVKLSANSSYGTSSDESSNREMETIEFFRAIVGEIKSVQAEQVEGEPVGQAG